MKSLEQSVVTESLPCWVIGHRGAAAVCPENTLTSFRVARNAGACMVELDVQQSADGELVVFHDETLERLCGESVALAALSWHELAGKKVGQWQGAPLCMPRLDEVFATFRRSLLYNIELKTNVVRYEGIEARLAALVHAYDLRERVLVSSFQLDSLRVLREQAPDLALGLLVDLDQGVHAADADALVRHAQTLGCFSLHPDFRLIRIYPELVQSCHDANLRVFPWTVDNAHVWGVLVREQQVDGIITNDPGKLYEWLRAGAAHR